MLQFRILGPVEVLADGRPVALGAPKQRALLAFLLLRRRDVVPRDRLVDAVWGEAPPASAVRALQVYVHGLRRALGADRIETRGAGYRVRLEDEELDLERFEGLVARGRRALEAGAAADAMDDLQAALALWRGPALADLPREAPVAADAAGVDELRLEALELRAAAALAAGRHESLAAELEPLIAEHPYRERLREHHILALYRSGRQKAALDAHRAARSVLVEELGVEPGPGLQELERAILRQEPGLAAPEPPPRPARPLPAPPTPLVGRRLEAAAVAALLRDEDARLVTLTGPGGTGKTRLALAAAGALAPEPRDGAVFVDLSAVSDPDLLGSSIAGALGVEEGGRALAEAVGDHLRPLRLLLVLDNLEQLAEASPFVTDLLRAAPRLLVLATSRSPLRLSGEHEYPVPPLDVPEEGADAYERIAASDAVQLFAARARATDRDFMLTTEVAPAVARICRCLDGLPLAIELAAARVKVLPPAAMADRLDRALDVLVGGPRDVAPRQRTLRATLDWSYELLEDGGRALLSRLGCFAGGATLEAVEAACAQPGTAVAEPLQALVDANLVRRRGDRFTMLETVRAYAAELLAAGGEEAELRGRHCRHFLAVAERACERMLANEADDALDASLDAEHDNLRAAIDWAAEAGEVELEVRLAVALRQFWLVRGHLSEGRRFFARSVDHTAGGEPSLRLKALMHGGPFPYRRGELTLARAWWEEGLAIAQELGDANAIGRCAGELGGVAYSEGDPEGAAALWTEAAARFAELGDEMRRAIVTANLAELAAMQGDLETAAREGERTAGIQRRIGERDGLAITLHGIARVRRRMGAPEAARPAFAESLALARALGYREVLANCVEGAAELALDGGDPALAAALLAAARRMMDEIGVRLQGIEAEAFAELEAALGAEAVAAVAALTDDDAVARAIEVLERPLTRPRPG